MLRAGVDIGGTFTDLCVVDRDRVVAVGKTLTTPHDPSEGVETVLAETLGRIGLGFSDLRHVVHGTTLVTNAIIERRGSSTALLTTQGFRDAIEIGIHLAVRAHRAPCFRNGSRISRRRDKAR